MTTPSDCRPADVSAVVCTMNSASSIEACLRSLREAGVGQIIVVDASSTDGTRDIASSLADLLLDDAGSGLAQARNVGIARTTGALVLNMGSDNVITTDALEAMIHTLQVRQVQGVSARTRVVGGGYVSRAMHAWRSARFRPGPSLIIGTPTLFIGELLRANPFNPATTVSDDSELCERWATQFGARFEISEASVDERGKSTWRETRIRCRMYGRSDEEIYRHGVAAGWGWRRRWRSITHPLRVDLMLPLTVLPWSDRLRYLPYLVAFTTLRYAGWIRACRRPGP
mgnify:CR=1 FL=1